MSRSVEFFHLYYRGFTLERMPDVYAHIHQSKQFVEGSDEIRMVMIDDQPVPKKDRANFFTPIIALLHEMQVDYVAYELDLNKLKEEWLATQTNAEELRKSIKKVYKGNLDCSHYIAIWYMLRLGLLPDKDIFIPVSRRAMNREVKPQQELLRNFLPIEYKAVEELTDAGILAFNVHAQSLRERIERIYYE